ncbi:hypothetical protein PybrP1_003352 [[Pythium] brassicae (nom. inval.)]|nr:hypothetical protein PybrP1_003352 [[Pythium] brassicae (nom. inval.)]
MKRCQLPRSSACLLVCLPATLSSLWLGVAHYRSPPLLQVVGQRAVGRHSSSSSSGRRLVLERLDRVPDHKDPVADLLVALRVEHDRAPLRVHVLALSPLAHLELETVHLARDLRVARADLGALEGQQRALLAALWRRRRTSSCRRPRGHSGGSGQGQHAGRRSRRDASAARLVVLQHEPLALQHGEALLPEPRVREPLELEVREHARLLLHVHAAGLEQHKRWRRHRHGRQHNADEALVVVVQHELRRRRRRAARAVGLRRRPRKEARAGAPVGRRERAAPAPQQPCRRRDRRGRGRAAAPALDAARVDRELELQLWMVVGPSSSSRYGRSHEPAQTAVRLLKEREPQLLVLLLAAVRDARAELVELAAQHLAAQHVLQEAVRELELGLEPAGRRRQRRRAADARRVDAPDHREPLELVHVEREPREVREDRARAAQQLVVEHGADHARGLEQHALRDRELVEQRREHALDGARRPQRDPVLERLGRRLGRRAAGRRAGRRRRRVEE